MDISSLKVCEMMNMLSPPCVKINRTEVSHTWAYPSATLTTPLPTLYQSCDTCRTTRYCQHRKKRLVRVKIKHIII